MTMGEFKQFKFFFIKFNIDFFQSFWLCFTYILRKMLSLFYPLSYSSLQITFIIPSLIQSVIYNYLITFI